MKLFTAIVAYMPSAHDVAMTTTDHSVDSTRQFEKLGTVVVYHAHEESDGFCEKVHPAFGKVPVREYINGSLAGNQKVLLEDAFEVEQADWCMFVSNDIIWWPDACERMEERLKTLNPMQFSVILPMCTFMMSRELYERMKPNLFFDYLPSGVEDDDLKMQAIAAGGELDRTQKNGTDGFFGGLETHGNDSTRAWFGGGYGKGGRDSNYLKNIQTFKTRWGRDPGFGDWPLPPEFIEEIRLNPRRPKP